MAARSPQNLSGFAAILKTAKEPDKNIDSNHVLILGEENFLILMAKSKKQWWATLFDEKYLKTYVDTVTPELTKQQIPFLLKYLQPKKGAEILDLACGHGRHSIELAKLGYKVTGLDFSKHFIDIAKEDAKAQEVKVNFICDDMRNLSFVNRFDAVINMFTSFGYFEDENDNELVLRKISRALKPDGKFLIEINNMVGNLARALRKGKIDRKTGFLIIANKDKLSNGLIVTTKDELNPTTMRWSMTRTWKENGKVKSYKTNVRIFSLPELGNMMERNGLRIEKIWGNMQGSPFGFDSRRLVALARKS